MILAIDSQAILLLEIGERLEWAERLCGRNDVDIDVRSALHAALEGLTHARDRQWRQLRETRDKRGEE